jgi:hypothetical protein
VAGLAADGGFRVELGRGISLSADQMDRPTVAIAFDEAAPQPVPGLLLRRFEYERSRGRGTLRADLNVPFVENVRGGIVISVDREGRAAFRGTFTPRTQLGALQNPQFTLAIDEDRNITGSFTVGPSNLTPAALRGRLSVAGEGTIRLRNGRLSGAVEADLAYTNFGTGRIDLAFTETGELSGSGHVVVTRPYLEGARADLAVDGGNVRADARIPAATLQPPIPGLEIAEGTVHLVLENTTPSGGLEAVKLSYAGLGAAILNARIERGVFSGDGTFDVTIAELADVTGRVRFDRQGVLTGTATIRSSDFPEGLPVQSGSITGTLRPDGGVDFSGQVVVGLGPAGTGQLRASWIDGRLNVGTTIDLTVPGLDGARFTIDYVDGGLQGEGDVPIDPQLLQGITGAVHVEYREQRWAGETELSYEADDGKLSGTVRVGVRQNEEGGLNVFGGGEVTARIAPRIEGMLGMNINEDGSIDLSGAIVVTEPIEMFPEWRGDRELFRISRNIPLWAILVAVIRVRGGVRAGIGPGVFRDIRVEGEYTVGGDPDAEPSLRISGEMFIPAFVEAYVAFGAGLGVSVVLGSLTGGIEGVATAGLYGAISVVPELAYENGDYSIEGTATLAAGARLKVGLNAWAEVEALWVTVWENTWRLGEWVWNVGPDLALQARMQYTFGHPEPPSIEFSTDDIDSERLIQEAMPRDGPATSGAREALQNRAEWQGALQRQGRDSGRLPAELQEQAQEAPEAPQPEGRPSGRPRHGEGNAPAAGADAADGPAPEEASAPGADARAQEQAREEAARPEPGSEATVPASEVPTADQPRYPHPVTLATVDEPPAPMPRTHEQQQEDVEAAAEVVRLAADQADTTEELGAWFPRIRTRFQLASIGFEEASGLIVVRVAANPRIDVKIVEKVQGAGIAGWRTEITHQAGNIPGDPTGTLVGSAMEAPRLGPDHPQGGPPGGEHDRLMQLLMVDPGQSADSKYIRGHLLNDNLGGPGTATNLFPITGQANAQHSSAVESRVKEWVNTRRLWVYYKVEVDVKTPVAMTNPVNDRALNRIDADFICTASVLNTEGGESERVTLVVRSTFRVTASGPAALPDVLQQARDEDLAAPDPQLSSRHREGEYRLDPGIFDALQRANRVARPSDIDQKLLSVRHISTRRVELLRAFYGNALANANTDQSSLLLESDRGELTRLNGLAGEIIAALGSL